MSQAKQRAYPARSCGVGALSPASRVCALRGCVPPKFVAYPFRTFQECRVTVLSPVVHGVWRHTSMMLQLQRRHE